MQSRAAMAAELAEVQSEIVALRRELGLPAPPRRSLAQAPLAAANLLPRTLTEEERQIQTALAMSARSAAAAAGAPGPPGRVTIKRQVSGIDGVRTMAPPNPRRRPEGDAAVHKAAVEEVEEHEDEEGGEDEDWAPLTRQVSGRRGMQMASFHR